MRILRSSTLALVLSGCSIAALSTQARAQVSISVSVNTAPPPLPSYEQPPLPGEGYIWAPGFWAWDQSQADFFWVPATWVQPPEPDQLWTPGYWAWNNGTYVFNSGYWAPQVGFYGGIDYGYGYSGSGYQGGRWDHGAFFYNRAVNNIGSANVKNVYNETVFVNTRTNNVSYNGGKGGIEVRATPQELAVEKQRHYEATPLQTQHAEAASKNRALFSKENRGEPAIAATPRAGAFEGNGVMHAEHAPNKNGEPSKAEPNVEPVKDEPKAESIKPGLKAAPIKAEPKAEPIKAEPKAAPIKAEPKAEPTKAEPKAEPIKAEPIRAEPKAEPIRAEPKAEPIRAEPKAEPIKAEPKAEPVKPQLRADAPRPPAKPQALKEEPKDKDSQAK